MTDMEKLRREEKAWEYIQGVRRRRQMRVTWILFLIEVALVVYSILMAVAIYKGGVSV